MAKLRPGWALVRVRLAGICNTDVEILRGYHDFRGTPGHEFVGEVQEVGGVSAEVKNRWIGKRVVGEINIACRALGFRPICRFCKRGLTRHCERRKVLGIVAHDGAFAEYLTLPVENLHVIPNSISDEAAVFVEPLAAACEILDQVPIKQFREAAVLGDGKLAQLIARARGTLVLKSTFHGATPVETWPIVVKELSLVGSRCGPFDKAIALLRSRKIDPRPLITRTFPLQEASAAIAFAQKPGVMKVLLRA